MKKLWLTALGALVLILAVVAAAIAHGGGGRHGLKAHLSGYQETPPVYTAGTGRFKAKINGSQIDYRLTYSGLSSTATKAHIHFGQPGVAGGIVVALCGEPGKPACPPSGELTGTITAADVQAVQGIEAGRIDQLIDVIRHGLAYVNVHTTTNPTGEIRGQIGGKGRGFFGQKGGHGDFGQKGDHGDWGNGGKHNDD